MLQSHHQLSLFFQLTTSRGGRLDFDFGDCPPFVFQLTTSRGGRPSRACKSKSRYIFNSRPLGEVDWGLLCAFPPVSLFNSRPLGEVDLRYCFLCRLIRFSTHDLSGRSTAMYFFLPLAIIFSTHDLSGRSTAKLHNKSLKFCIFSGHFILEQMSLPFSYKYH